MTSKYREIAVQEGSRIISLVLSGKKDNHDGFLGYHRGTRECRPFLDGENTAFLNSSQVYRNIKMTTSVKGIDVSPKPFNTII